MLLTRCIRALVDWVLSTADFAGGGLMCVMGILMALMERSKSGKGQIIDANLVSWRLNTCEFNWQMLYCVTCVKKPHTLLDCWHILPCDIPLFNAKVWTSVGRRKGLQHAGWRCSLLRDVSHKGRAIHGSVSDQNACWRHADTRLFSYSGAIEPQFYAVLLEKLQLSKDDTLPGQLDKEAWPAMKAKFQSIFATKTQQEWCAIFDGSDACVTPVLSFQDPIPNTDRKAEAPHPAPHLSRTPAKKPDVTQEDSPPFLAVGDNSIEILKEFGIASDQIEKLVTSNALVDAANGGGGKSKL